MKQNEIIFSEGELFYEQKNPYPDKEFEVDGIKVVFRYIVEGMPHFDFYGDISETGYRSHFPYPEHLDEYGVEGTAREAIKVIRAKYYEERAKLERKKKRKDKLLCSQG